MERMWRERKNGGGIQGEAIERKGEGIRREGGKVTKKTEERERRRKSK